MALLGTDAYGSRSAMAARIAGFEAAFERAGWSVVKLGDGRSGASWLERGLERLLPQRALEMLRRWGIQGQVQPGSGLRLARALVGPSAGDVVVLSVPPISLLAAVLVRFRRRAVILDYRDAWAVSERPPPLARLCRPLERAAIKRSWAITFAGGPVLGSRLGRIARPISGEIVAVANGVDAADLPRVKSCGRSEDGPLDLVIAGQVYGDNDWEGLVRALRSLPPLGFRLEILGNQPDYVRGWFAPLGDRVRWTPATDRRTLYSRLARADAGLVAVGESDDWRTRIPVKVYEYLACGLPVIALCPEGAALLDVAPLAHQFANEDWKGLADLLALASADPSILRAPPIGTVGLDRVSAAERLVRLAREVVAE